MPPITGAAPTTANAASAYPAVGVVIVDGGQSRFSVSVRAWGPEGIATTLAAIDSGGTAGGILSLTLTYSACARTLTVTTVNNAETFSSTVGLDLAATLGAPTGTALFSSFNVGVPITRTITATSFTSGVTLLRCAIANYTGSSTALTLAKIAGITAVVWGSSAGSCIVAAGNAVFSVSAAGSVVLLAGGDNSGFVDGAADVARFAGPRGLAFESSTVTLWVADTENHAIRTVRTTTGVVSSISGLSGVAGFADGACAAAFFNAPSGVALLYDANAALTSVAIADTANNVLRTLTLTADAGCTVALLSGSAIDDAGSADGPALMARFSAPAAIAADATSRLFIIDGGGFSLRRFGNGSVVTLTGFATWSDEDSALMGSYVDGAATAAGFGKPAGVAVNSEGTRIVVSDAHAVRILFQDPAWPASVWTLAGSATEGFANGYGVAAAFSFPSGIAFDSEGGGSILLADTGNGALRILPAEKPTACATASPRSIMSASATPRTTTSASSTSSVSASSYPTLSVSASAEAPPMYPRLPSIPLPPFYLSPLWNAKPQVWTSPREDCSMSITIAGGAGGANVNGGAGAIFEFFIRVPANTEIMSYSGMAASQDGAGGGASAILFNGRLIAVAGGGGSTSSSSGIGGDGGFPGFDAPNGTNSFGQAGQGGGAGGHGGIHGVPLPSDIAAQLQARAKGAITMNCWPDQNLPDDKYNGFGGILPGYSSADGMTRLEGSFFASGTPGHGGNGSACNRTKTSTQKGEGPLAGGDGWARGGGSANYVPSYSGGGGGGGEYFRTQPYVLERGVQS